MTETLDQFICGPLYHFTIGLFIITLLTIGPYQTRLVMYMSLINTWLFYKFFQQLRHSQYFGSGSHLSYPTPPGQWTWTVDLDSGPGQWTWTVDHHQPSGAAPPYHSHKNHSHHPYKPVYSLPNTYIFNSQYNMMPCNIEKVHFCLIYKWQWGEF